MRAVEPLNTCQCNNYTHTCKQKVKVSLAVTGLPTAVAIRNEYVLNLKIPTVSGSLLLLKLEKLR